MATSTNYLWTEPNDSDLVKNGASAIRTLGNAIDASLWSSGFGQAGKNKIINGDFKIWQRGTSITLPNNTQTYAQDRFYYYSTHSAGTATVTQQAFTAGSAPAAPYEGQYFARMTCASTTTYGEFGQKIEDVRTFANSTVTFSYWAKASVTTTLSQNIGQNFGSGGSSAVYTNPGSVTVTTSWQRFTTTVTMPSIAGKTIGSGNHVIVVFTFTPTASQTLDIWGVQLEAGATATPFQTASGGSPQAELAMCQRYYWRYTNADAVYRYLGSCYFSATTTALSQVPFPVTMRTTPTTLDFSNIVVQDSSGTIYTTSSNTLTETGTIGTSLNMTVAGATVGRPGRLFTNNASGAYLGFGAEL